MTKIRHLFLAGLMLTGLAVVPAVSRADCVNEAPVVVGSTPGANPIDPTVDPAWAAAGLAPTSIAIHTNACDANPTIEFDVNVQQLNAPPPNEVERYLWYISINGHEYWLQAKTSDAAAATTLPDDPQGQVTHLQGSFRLRGDCSVEVAVSTCHHLAWLDGAFDTAKSQVRLYVPLGFNADFAGGQEIGPGSTSGVDACIQAETSNASTCENLPQDDNYTIPA